MVGFALLLFLCGCVSVCVLLSHCRDSGDCFCCAFSCLLELHTLFIFFSFFGIGVWVAFVLLPSIGLVWVLLPSSHSLNPPFWNLVWEGVMSIHPSLIIFSIITVVAVACWGVSPVWVLDSTITTISLSVFTAFSPFRVGIVGVSTLTFSYNVCHLTRLSADWSRVKV